MKMEQKQTTTKLSKKEYYHNYYLQNKERIQERHKALYKKRRSTEEGLLNERKRCLKHTHTYRKKHKERVQQSRKATYNNRKFRALKMINEEVKCSRCGCDVLDLLEINHINGGGCKELKKVGGSLYDKILSGERDTQGLEILCRVCNALDYVERKQPEIKGMYQIKFDIKKSHKICE